MALCLLVEKGSWPAPPLSCGAVTAPERPPSASGTLSRPGVPYGGQMRSLQGADTP